MLSRRWLPPPLAVSRKISAAFLDVVSILFTTAFMAVDISLSYVLRIWLEKVTL